MEILLSKMKAGEGGIVKRIEGGQGLERRLASLGIRVGKPVEKITSGALGGPMVLEVDGAQVAIGRGMAAKVLVEVKRMKILLMGNPNVGKSVIFSRLTGTNVIVSNYPGTTIEFTKGAIKFDGSRGEVIDVPGTYALEPTSRVEETAVEMLKEGDVIINVVDATNLERHLYLTLQLLEQNIPVVVALNFWDDAKHKGIGIDVEGLERILGVPVVPTVAVTGVGIKELVSRISEAKAHARKHEEEERWAEIGRIVKKVQSVTHRHHTLLEKLGDASIHTSTGIPIAVAVLLLAFEIIRLIGEGMISRIFDPAFNLYASLVLKLSSFVGPGFVHDLLFGEMINGKVDYIQSMGLLTTGVYVPIALVLPYVFSFYLVLGFLEDSGYLPRLAVLADNLMHRLGLHGAAVIPMMLGLGCNVPGALSTRILETKRQRFIAATLMAIAVPCMAQLAIIAVLVGRYGASGLGIVFAVLFSVWLTLGMVLNKFMKGESPEIFMEIPPYRVIYLGALSKKLWMRMKWFIAEAVPLVLFGVFLVNVLYFLGALEFVGKMAAPVVVGLFGLPAEAAGALVVGFLRKDVAVGMLIPLGLTLKQSVIASIVLTMYFPCVGTFSVLIRELGAKDMLKSASIMVISTLLVGGVLNLVWGV